MAIRDPIARAFAGTQFSNATTPQGTGQQIIDITPREFRDLRGPVAGGLRDIINNEGFQFQGPLAAGITGKEQGLVDRIGDLTGGPSALQQQGRRLLERTIGGEFLSPDSNPFLQDVISSAIRRINEGNAANNSAVIGQFKRAGGTLRSDPNRVGSSAFLNQARLGERDRLNAIGDITSSILGQNFQAERARQEAAIGQAENISTQDINNAIQGLQASALPRLIEDLGIQRGIEEFNQRIARLLEALRQGGGASQPTPVSIAAVPAQESAFGAAQRASIGGFA